MNTILSPNFNNYNYNTNLKKASNIAFTHNITKHFVENYKGCILGGALGDAFGGPLERLSIEEINHKFKGDLMYMLKEKDGFSHITDDTQMTLFTIDGLLNAYGKFAAGSKNFINELAKSYKNWVNTQELKEPSITARGLMKNKELYAQREPGFTCLTALKYDKFGTVKNKINNSAGNGGVMRSAPIGLMFYDDSKLAFEIGTKAAAITHGNPRGYFSAGSFASVIANIIQGKPLDVAIKESINLCEKKTGTKSIVNKFKQAMDLASSDVDEKLALRKIGSGWTGDEALAIGIYSNLKHPENIKDIIRTAANHSGDSDTAASIAGNIAGANLGSEGLPGKWLKNLELKNILDKYTSLLFAVTNHNNSLLERQSADSLKIVSKP